MSDAGDHGTPAGGARFLTTRWSVVRSAAGEGARARASLEELCGAYWYPLYAYVRRRGRAAAEAEDLTQEFFARLLERRDLGAADPGRGRFRAFLLAALDHFLANEWKAARALKRGGGARVLSIDWRAADERYGLEPARDDDPQRVFEREWALSILERAMERLRAQYEARGQAELFERLKGELAPGADPAARGALARELDLREGALKVALHRLRRRFGEAVRAEIGDTVASPDEVQGELRELFEALGR